MALSAATQSRLNPADATSWVSVMQGKLFYMLSLGFLVCEMDVMTAMITSHWVIMQSKK